MLCRSIVILFFSVPFFEASASNNSIMDTSAFRQFLQELTRGLLYSSESDYPFEILDWGTRNEKEIKLSIEQMHPGSKPAEKINASAFFEKYIRIQEMSGDEIMIAIANRYKALQAFLETNSDDVEVWRCGKIQVGIYIVIRSKEGKTWVLKTTAIET